MTMSCDCTSTTWLALALPAGEDDATSSISSSESSSLNSLSELGAEAFKRSTSRVRLRCMSVTSDFDFATKGGAIDLALAAVRFLPLSVKSFMAKALGDGATGSLDSS